MSKKEKKNNKQKKVQGFTIIEVTIVLAIAGLILVIVLLAVPAVLRSSRNYTRNHDAEIVKTGREQYDMDRLTDATTPYESTCASAADPNNPKKPIPSNMLCGYMVGLGYYNLADIHFSSAGSTKPTSLPPTPTGDTIYSAGFYVCNANEDGATTTGAGSRTVVILYATENTDGSLTQHCIDATGYSAT